MSENYSVSATISAKDQGFTSTLKAGLGTLDSFTAKVAKSGSVFKSVLGANVIGAGITKGISLVGSGVRSLVSDLDESSKAWQVFQGNMEQLKMPTKDIQAAKKDMQQFATQTIYSASDMASTYSQLAAVGIKNTGQLVKGFGGLAAASAEPKQAMKTLSQQATQMAAKPMVQWQDFKLMLEQTPAGIAAVAKTMGMETKDLVKNVQDGTVETQKFFDAITETGTNANFTKMATQFKTVGQAIDGLKEGLSNKLQPVFDKVSKKGISLVTQLSDAIDKIDFEKIANKAMAFVGKIGKGFSQVWSGFKDSGAITSLSSAFSAVGAAINHIKAALSGGTGEGLEKLGASLGGITSKAAGIIENVANAIAKMSPGQINQVVGALKAAATAMLAFRTGSIAFQKGLAVYNGVTKAVVAIKTLTSALKGLAAVKGGKGANPLADIPTAPATSKLSGWAGIAKSMGVIIAIGASMKLVASAFKDMSSINVSWGQLSKNLTQMGVFLLSAAVSMGVIGGAIQLFPPIASALAIGAGVFVGLAGTMALVGKGLASFAKSSATAIKAVNGIKVDKNFPKKLTGILDAMSGLAVVGGYTGLLGTLAAPFAALGNIGFSVIKSTITKVVKFANDLNKLKIPSSKGIKTKLKKVQEIATSLTSFKMGKVGNIGAVFSSAFANLATGNIIGTFKKVSKFVQQVNKMPSIDISKLRFKFKVLSDFREALNDAVQGSSTGGNNIDAAISSWFGKIETENVIGTFKKVSDFIQQLNKIPSIDISKLRFKFKILSDFRDALNDAAQGSSTGGNNIDAAISSWFGKIDTENVIGTFKKVSNFIQQLNKIPSIDISKLRFKFKILSDFRDALNDAVQGSSTGGNNIDAAISSWFGKIDIENVIGTFKKVSKFVQQVNKMPSIDVVDLRSKFKVLSDFRDSLNKAMQGSSTGGNSVDASFNSFFGKLDTGNIISAFRKVSDFVKKLSAMDSIDDSDIDNKFASIKKILTKMSDFASEKFDWSIFTSIASFFGKLDTGNLVSSFTKVADLATKIEKLPNISDKSLDGKFKSIKSVFNKLKDFKVDTPPDSLKTALDSIQKITGPLSEIAKKFQSLNGVVVNSTNIINTMSAIKSITDFLPNLNFTIPKGFEASITNIVKPVSSLTSVAKKLQEMSGVVINSVNVINTMNAIKDIIKNISDAFATPLAKGIGANIEKIIKPVSSLMTLSKKLQEMSGVVVNSVNVINTMNAIKDIIKNLSDAFAASLPEGIGANIEKAIKPVSSLMTLSNKLQELSGVVVNSTAVIATMNAIMDIVSDGAWITIQSVISNWDGMESKLKIGTKAISSLMVVANKLQELSGVVVNSTAVIATMNAIMDIVSDGAWITIQSVVSNWGGMQADLQTGISAVNSIKNLVNAMNSIPAVSTDIQANVDNIQKGLDKLSGLNFSADIAGKAAQFAAAVNNLLASLKNMGSNFAPAGNEWASQIVKGFATGISSSTGRATSAVRNMISSVRSSAASSAGQFQSVGAMIGAGLAAGMYSALGQVRAAADALVSEANRAAQAKAKIHSPSRLFRDEVGRYIGAGVAIGITKSTSNVVGATKLLTNKTLNAATSMLPKLQTISTKMMDAVTPDVSALSNFAQDSRANFESKLNANYSYNQPIYVTAEVTSNLDGKKVGYGSAQYVKEKNDADAIRFRRIGGKF